MNCGCQHRTPKGVPAVNNARAINMALLPECSNSPTLLTETMKIIRLSLIPLLVNLSERTRDIGNVAFKYKLIPGQV
jgi:hypothetical protein